jgi:hypothetical protein
MNNNGLEDLLAYCRQEMSLYQLIVWLEAPCLALLTALGAFFFLTVAHSYLLAYCQILSQFGLAGLKPEALGNWQDAAGAISVLLGVGFALFVLCTKVAVRARYGAPMLKGSIRTCARPNGAVVPISHRKTTRMTTFTEQILLQSGQGDAKSSTPAKSSVPSRIVSRVDRRAMRFD